MSAVASWDWPENWPNLFDQLMAGLGSGSPELVHGTMRVLVEFCQDVADTQMPQVAPVILPQLLSVISQPQVSDDTVCGSYGIISSSLRSTVLEHDAVLSIYSRYYLV